MKNRILVFGLLLFAVGLGLVGCGSKSTPAAPSAPAPAPPPYGYTLSAFFGSTGTIPMNGPFSPRVSGDTLWVGNLSAAGLQGWTLGGNLSLSVTSYASHPLQCNRVAVGPDGYIYGGDTNLNQVVEFNATGSYEGVFGTTELAGGTPTGIAVNATDAYVSRLNVVFHYTVSGAGNSKIFQYQGLFGNTGAGTLIGARGMCLSGSNLWVADSSNSRLVEFNQVGVYQKAVTVASSGYPEDVAVDSSGNLLTADLINHEIQVFNSSGAPVTAFGSNDLSWPVGLAVDPQNNLYVADYYSNQVVVFKRN